jgi:Fe-S oxidoreductase
MNQDPVSLLGPAGIWVFWGLSVAAFGVFGRRMFQLIQLLRQGRAENRFDQLGKRVQHMLQHVLLQPRLFNEKSIGLPHFLIFWGFVVYASCFNWSLVRGLFPFLPIPYPEELNLVGLFLEIFSLLVLASLGVALARRLFFAPPHLHLSTDANLILALIGLLMVTTLVGSGARVIAEGHATWGQPIGGLMSGAFAGLGRETALKLSHGMWWLHMITVLFFLVYLPYSKHMHLLASPFNVFFSNLGEHLGTLNQTGTPEDYTAGASAWPELTWKQLLSGFSCAECGRCDRSCPAATAGFPLEPQQIIQRIKQHVVQTGLKPAGTNGHGAPKLLGDVIKPSELWACTTCMACMNCCAVWNEQVPLVVQFRRHLVAQGEVERTVQDMLANLTRYGNSFGKSDRMRARWVQASGLKIKDARKEPVEYLWFVGDYASFDPRLEDITRKTAHVFNQAGLDFGLLYEGERNAGNDVRRIGEEGLFEMLRDKNQQAMGKAKFKTIVTTDPHTFNTLKNEYPWNGDGITVKHYTEVLDELIQQGRLPIKHRLSGKVTYHDPCYLGRYNGIYDAPRRILEALGVDLIEMPRHHDRSYCCGAGGGRIWMEDVPGIKERPAENRIREAASLPDVNTLVVACPKDIAMFRDAVKTTGNEGKVVVRDLIELVAEAAEIQTANKSNS